MNRREWLTTVAGSVAGWHGLVLPDRAPARVDAASLSLPALADAFAAGRLMPLDVAAAYLEAIDRRNPSLGAYVTISRDRAVDETRRLMARPGGAAARGPLFGVPIAHKDLLATRGVRTTGGSRLHESWVPDEDADLVARFSAAGAVMLGKTNTHELGGGVTTINPFFGTTRNPRDTTRIPGGSSGGSAAAVADGLALVATGSDTGGSIRIPAALCGCVGLKPTFGRFPTRGLLGACPTMDHVGWLTRTAEDAAIVFAALAPSTLGRAAGVDIGDRLATYRRAVARGTAGLRVGVPRRYFFERLGPDVIAAVDRTLAALTSAGAVRRDVALPLDDRTYDAMFAPIVVSEIRATYAGDWARRPEAFSKEFAAVFEGPPVADAELVRAQASRRAFEQAVAAVFAEVDVLAMPTVPVVAPPIAGPIDGMRILQNTWAFNAARVPAVSVRCGSGEAGMPVGLQLVGRADGEPALLAVATLVERLTADSRPA
jgi:aspartyl-tRNA(Asn)/glutamyl-tRNA(Gln) amidotransferase subunit A